MACSSCVQQGLTLAMTAVISSKADTQPSDVGKAIRALGKDIANKMEAIDRRLAALEQLRSAVQCADDRLVDSSTPAPEVRKNGCSTPASTDHSLGPITQWTWYLTIVPRSAGMMRRMKARPAPSC